MLTVNVELKRKENVNKRRRYSDTPLVTASVEFLGFVGFGIGIGTAFEIADVAASGGFLTEGAAGSELVGGAAGGRGRSRARRGRGRVEVRGVGIGGRRRGNGVVVLRRDCGVVVLMMRDGDCVGGGGGVVEKGGNGGVEFEVVTLKEEEGFLFGGRGDLAE